LSINFGAPLPARPAAPYEAPLQNAVVIRPAPVRLSGREIVERLVGARPDLSPHSPDWQAAVLLLHASSVGLNVDRLVLRTGFPREFVARSLRRLVDNSCWIDGELQAKWTLNDLRSGDFWMDVGVALGHCLRRLDERGKPEWAPVGGAWVKEFNYRSAGRPEDPIHNRYLAIAPADPDVETPGTTEAEPPGQLAVAAIPERAAPVVEPAQIADRTGTPLVPNGRIEAVPALSNGWEHANWLG
jgi:hypothetical protein